MIDCNGLEHAVQTFERFKQRFGVFLFADVQDERIGLTDLLG